MKNMFKIYMPNAINMQIWKQNRNLKSFPFFLFDSSLELLWKIFPSFFLNFTLIFKFNLIPLTQILIFAHFTVTIFLNQINLISCKNNSSINRTQEFCIFIFINILPISHFYPKFSPFFKFFLLFHLPQTLKTIIQDWKYRLFFPSHQTTKTTNILYGKI